MGVEKRRSLQAAARDHRETKGFLRLKITDSCLRKGGDPPNVQLDLLFYSLGYNL
jgi:hypothetical protein